jgi:anti-anti-sigma factor
VIEVLHEAETRESVVFVDLTHGSTHDLAGLLSAAVVSGAPHVVVDLGDELDVGADVLTLLARAARRMRQLGGDLGVVANRPEIRRLLDVTLLSQAFPVFTTRDEALRAEAT